MPSFKEEVNSTIEQLKQANPAGYVAIGDFEQKLSEEEAYQRALRKGDKIPRFSLPDSSGKQVDIEEFHKDKFLVLVFYRGQWCPFCNLQLRDLQRSLSAIKGAPANLVAISPQTEEKSAETKKNFNLNFPILSDRGNKAAAKFNLVYQLPEYLVNTYRGFGVDIEQYNGQNSIALPFPATYIINREGVIIKDFIGAKLSERAEGKDVLDFLKSQL